jgi:hypothetical protein
MSEAFKSVEQGLKESLVDAKGEGASLAFQVDLSETDLPQNLANLAVEDPSTPVAKSKASKGWT